MQLRGKNSALPRPASDVQRAKKSNRYWYQPMVGGCLIVDHDNYVIKYDFSVLVFFGICGLKYSIRAFVLGID